MSTRALVHAARPAEPVRRKRPPRSPQPSSPAVPESRTLLDQRLAAQLRSATCPEGAPAALPHRAAMEARFGALPPLTVRHRPDASHPLRGASQPGSVTLFEPSPTEATVAHEVTHALQRPQRAGVAPPGSMAEREAERRAAPHAMPLPPSRPGVASGYAVAFRPREMSAADQAMYRPRDLFALFQRSPDGSSTRDSAARPSTPETATPASPEATQTPSAPAVPEQTAPGETAGTEPAPAGNLPIEAGPTAAIQAPPVAHAAPEPQADVPETAAPRPAEADVQETPAAVALDTHSAAGVMGSFAHASPSAQAASWPNLGEALLAGATNEQAAVQAAVPTPMAAVPGAEAAPTPDTSNLTPAPVTLGLPPVATSKIPTIDVPKAASAAPLPKVPAPQDNAQAQAAAVAQTLSAPVAVTEGVPTGVGAPPAVLDGAAEAEKLEAQGAAAATTTTTAAADARSRLEAAPDASVLVPVALEAEVEAPVLNEVAPAAPAEVDGMAWYRAQALPPEVQAGFDTSTATLFADDAANAALETAAATRETAQQNAETEAATTLADAEIDAQNAQSEAATAQGARITAARTRAAAEQAEVLDAHTSKVEGQETAQSEAIAAEATREQAAVEARYDAADQEIADKTASAQNDASKAQQDASKQAEGQSWWDRAVSFVQEALSAYLSVVKAIIDTLRSAVSTVVDAAVGFAKERIAAVQAFAVKAVQAYGTFLKGAVDALLKEHFPEIAAALGSVIDGAVELYTTVIEAVGGALQTAVDAAGSALKAGINGALSVWEKAVETAVGMAQAALSGDWSEVVRLLLESVLQLAGISPEGFYGLVGTAVETWTLIVENPPAFAMNLIDAGKLGLENFVEHLQKHLVGGFVAWLSGTFAGEIVIPDTLDLFGVLDIVRQVLGLTMSHIEKVARDVLGDTAVDTIRYVVDKLNTLVSSGWSALWEELKADLSGFISGLVPGLIEWASVQLVKAVMPKLLAFVDISGISAIVTAVQLAWGAYQFWQNQFQRIYAVVQRVVEAVSDIAHGVIDPAAAKVEEVLGQSVPVVLDLAAELLGISVVDKVQEVIGQARAWIDDAMRRLIGTIKALFVGGGEKGEAKKADDDTEVGETITFGVHRTWLEVKGDKVIPHVASDERPLVEQLSEWQLKLDGGGVGLTEVQVKDAVGLLARARTLSSAVQRTGDEALVADLEARRNAAKAEQADTKDAQAEKAQTGLVPTLKELFGIFGDHFTASPLAHPIYQLVGEPIVVRGTPATTNAAKVPDTPVADIKDKQKIFGPYYYLYGKDPMEIRRNPGGKNTAAGVRTTPEMRLDAQGILREGTPQSGEADLGWLVAQAGDVIAHIRNNPDDKTLGGLATATPAVDFGPPWVAAFATAGARLLAQPDGQELKLADVFGDNIDSARDAVRAALVVTLTEMIEGDFLAAAREILEEPSAPLPNQLVEDWAKGVAIELTDPKSALMSTPLVFVSPTEMPRSLRDDRLVAVNKAAATAISAALYTKVAKSIVGARGKLQGQIHHLVPLYLGGGHQKENLLHAFGDAKPTEAEKARLYARYVELLGKHAGKTAHQILHELIDQQKVEAYLTGGQVLEKVTLDFNSLAVKLTDGLKKILLGVLAPTGDIRYSELNRTARGPR